MSEIDTILKEIREDPYTFYSFSPELRNKDVFAREAFKMLPDIISCTTVQFSREELLDGLSKSVGVFAYLNDIYKKDPEFISVARPNLDYQAYKELDSEYIQKNDYLTIINNSSIIIIHAIRKAICTNATSASVIFDNDMSTPQKNIVNTLKMLEFIDALEKHHPDVYLLFEISENIQDIKKYAKAKANNSLEIESISLPSL